MNDRAPPLVRLTLADAGPDSGSILKALNHPLMSRWIGWRLRILVVLTLAGCLMLLMLAQWVAGQPHLDGVWSDTRQGRIQLVSAQTSELKPYVGKVLGSIAAGGQSADLDDVALVQRSARWLTRDLQRAQQIALHRKLAGIMAHERVILTFDDGANAVVEARGRGFGRLPVTFWLLAACALTLYLASMVVLLAKPSRLNLLYLVMALCQSGNLAFGAVESALDLGMPPALLHVGFSVRCGFDLFSAAAMVHAVSLHPQRLPGAPYFIVGGWGAALIMFALLQAEALGGGWWWLQGAVAVFGFAVVALLAWSYRREPRPLALALRRFGILAVGIWILLTVALGATGTQPWLQTSIASMGSMFWYLALAGLLLLTPFLSRSLQVMREFGLLAAVSTLATLLDLLFVTVFSFGQLVSGAISLFIALGVYLAVRQWLLNRLLGASMTTTERMFEQLYRVAREVEAQPDKTPALLGELLRELFEPIDVQTIQDPVSRTRVTSDGSTMLVPVPALAADEQGHDGSIVLRFAQRGNRLFTTEDTRLTDRIVEQLERAVAYDRAVERGRGEERLRIAQDLHDDIGARLLTLIYKAESPEMEEYARHTLQDLKTLTRGLAAPSHRLSHAAAEWKADLAQRLSAASIEFGWSCEFDEDITLSVVQWSALTRVMRELVSNAIAHSLATQVEISMRLDADTLELKVRDNGIGRGPKNWSHGLGLSGVRKRVKQLGGQVEWAESSPRGIVCSVTVHELSKHR
jgi:signal transduction histidine kinase